MGADVDKPDKDGETPLQQAAYRGHTGCARALLRTLPHHTVMVRVRSAEAGADWRLGETALYYARVRGTKEVEALLREWDTAHPPGETVNIKVVCGVFSPHAFLWADFAEG